MNETKKPAKKSDRQAEQSTKVGNASKSISLAPLSFDEALDGLLGVRPEPKNNVEIVNKKKVKKN